MIGVIRKKCKEVLGFIRSKYMYMAMESGQDISSLVKNEKVDDVMGKAMGYAEWDSYKEWLVKELRSWEKDTRKAKMEGAGIPGCFANMPSYTFHIDTTEPVRGVRDYYKLQNWENLLQETEEAGKRYLEYLDQLVRCSRCSFFDRCHKLTSLKVLAEKEFVLYNE